MLKGVSFNASDKELVERICKYQEENHLPSFVAAVRILCRDALDMRKLFKK